MNGVTKNDQKEIFYPMDDLKFGKKGFKMVKNYQNEKKFKFLSQKNVFRIRENRDISIDFLLF